MHLRDDMTVYTFNDYDTLSPIKKQSLASNIKGTCQMRL